MFCQLDVLRHCFPPYIRRALSELPESMDETFVRILREIEMETRDPAYRLLQCISVAARPLRVEELAEILALDFDVAEASRPVGAAGRSRANHLLELDRGSRHWSFPRHSIFPFFRQRLLDFQSTGFSSLRRHFPILYRARGCTHDSHTGLLGDSTPASRQPKQRSGRTSLPLSRIR